MRLMLRAKHTRFSGLFEEDELPSYNRCQVPQRIWSYWDTGEENAPEIVKFCLRSWREQNPDWSTIVLSDETLGEYISFEGIPQNVTKTRQSNIIRMRLLSKYGGVWVDSTTYCATSLNSWIRLVSGGGFFVFFRETRYRGIATWFMASKPNGYIINRYRNVYEPHLQFYGERYRWAVQNTFEYLTIFDRHFRREFRKMPMISAQPSLEIERWMRDPQNWPKPIPKDIPVYKFSWKTKMPLSEVISILNVS